MIILTFFPFSYTLICLMEGIRFHLDICKNSSIRKKPQKLLVYMMLDEKSDFPTKNKVFLAHIREKHRIAQ